MKVTGKTINNHSLSQELMNMLNEKYNNKVSKKLYEFYQKFKELQIQFSVYIKTELQNFFKENNIELNSKGQPTKEIKEYSEEIQNNYMKLFQKIEQKNFKFNWTKSPLNIRETKPIWREIFEDFFIFPEN